MITQLNPPLPLSTTRGAGLAHFLIDYGPEQHLMWVVFLDANGECWTVPNPEVRIASNWSLRRRFPTEKLVASDPITPPEPTPTPPSPPPPETPPPAPDLPEQPTPVELPPMSPIPSPPPLRMGGSARPDSLIDLSHLNGAGRASAGLTGRPIA